MEQVFFDCNQYDEHKQIDNTNIDNVEWATAVELQDDKNVYFVDETVDVLFKEKINSAQGEV